MRKSFQEKLKTEGDTIDPKEKEEHYKESVPTESLSKD